MRIGAGEMNELASAAAFVQQLRNSPKGKPARFLPRNTSTLRVKNATGADLAFGEVVALETPIFTPTDNLGFFHSQAAMVATVPTGTTAGRIGFTLQPIPADGVGFVAVAGVCVAKVDPAQPEALSASEVAGETGHLVLAAGGHVQVLWRESGSSGLKWAVVRLAGGGSGAPEEFFLIDDAETELVVGSDPPQWDYVLLPATRGSDRVVSAIAGAAEAVGWNNYEDQDNWGHGQSLTLANGATLVPSPVKGPVWARWTGRSISGVKVYEFDEQCPTDVECGGGA